MQSALRNNKKIINIMHPMSKLISHNILLYSMSVYSMGSFCRHDNIIIVNHINKRYLYVYVI